MILLSEGFNIFKWCWEFFMIQYNYNPVAAVICYIILLPLMLYKIVKMSMEDDRWFL